MIKQTPEGIVLINKPIGPSSFDVVRKVRKLAGIKSVGHAGTLDPLASGVMVVCLGRYTKLAGYLTEQDKVYDAMFRLGIKTTTDDAEGEIIAEHSTEQVDEAQVRTALSRFYGTIMQMPPRYSAIKIDGQRAYAMARADEEFEIVSRPVQILSITDVKIGLPDVSLRVHCSKGTYIRSLARDLGDALGVGAHASLITRVRSGSFTIDDAMSLDELSAENFSSRLVTGRAALSNLALISITQQEQKEFSFGRHPCHGMSMTSEIAIAVCGDEPVAIMRNDNGRPVIARVI